MKTALRTIVVALTLGFTLSAQAQGYLGIYLSAPHSSHIAAGYSIGEHVGVELGYLDLGRTDSGSSSAKASGLGLAVVGRLPIGSSWSLIGKAGAWRLEAESSSSCGSLCVSSSSSTISAPYLAIGAELHAAGDLYLQGLAERIQAPSGSALESVDLYSIGAVLRF